MAEIRIRCQVLKVITGIDSGTADDVAKYLPDLKPSQVQKALAHLCEDDEIRTVGKRPKTNSGGLPWNIYQIRDEKIPRNVSKKKVYKKTGRKSHSEELHKPVSYNKDRNILIIKYRERKIILLTRLLSRVHGHDKDLLIGCINDYKAQE